MSRGHTLIEILIALAVLAVLAGAAAPAFTTFWLDARRDARVSAISHAAHSARQLAAARGISLSLCGSNDGLHCSGERDWSAGILLAAADGEALRSIAGAIGAGTTQVRSNRTSLEFQPAARYATTATIVVCDRRGSAAARAVIVSRSGRPRVSSRDASGRALSC